MTAATCVRLRARPLASMFGSKSSSLTAARTRWRVLAATGCDEPLNTRDTVAVETEASAATSWSDDTSGPLAAHRGCCTFRIAPDRAALEHSIDQTLGD